MAPASSYALDVKLSQVALTHVDTEINISNAGAFQSIDVYFGTQKISGATDDLGRIDYN